MDLVVILKKLEDAYNQEDWNIIEEIIETISYAVENDGESLYYDEQYDLCNFKARSCEMLAKELLEEFDLVYCSVFEDNENGAEIYG